MSQHELEPGPGTYLNYKGDPYKVICIAMDKDSHDELVVYQALYGERLTWVRPRRDFLSEVEWNGVRLPRFRRLEDAEESCRSTIAMGCTELDEAVLGAQL